MSANLMDIGGGEGLRHYTALENTEDGSRGQKAREALYERCAQRDEAKAHDEQGQVVLWAYSLEEDVRWDWDLLAVLMCHVMEILAFDEHVDDVEDGGDPVEAVAGVEAQFDTHTLDARISYICTETC